MKPKQFDFQLEWHTSVKSVRKNPRVIEEMEAVRREWFTLVESIRDFEIEEHPEEEVQAQAEYDLELRTFAVKKWDLFWQRKWTGNDTPILASLALGIAEALFPNMKWEYIEKGDRAVVTDSERTLVFDIQNFDKLGGGASLHLVDDPKYIPDDIDKRQVIAFREGNIARDMEAVRIMKETIDNFDRSSESNVFPLKP